MWHLEGYQNLNAISSAIRKKSLLVDEKFSVNDRPRSLGMRQTRYGMIVFFTDSLAFAETKTTIQISKRFSYKAYWLQNIIDHQNEPIAFSTLFVNLQNFSSRDWWWHTGRVKETLGSVWGNETLCTRGCIHRWVLPRLPTTKEPAGCCESETRQTGACFLRNKTRELSLELVSSTIPPALLHNGVRSKKRAVPFSPLSTRYVIYKAIICYRNNSQSYPLVLVFMSRNCTIVLLMWISGNPPYPYHI
jgi:hypothetical protein